MSSRTLLVLVSLVAGILLAGSGPLDLTPWAGTSAFAVVGLWWRQGGGARAGLLVAVALLVGLLNGLLALHRALSAPLAELGARILAEGADEIVTVEGRLRGDATPTDYGVAVLIDVERLEWRGETFPTSGGVRVGVGGTVGRERMDTWRGGRRVRVPVVLRRPQQYKNPGSPDQTRALALRGITWLSSAKSGALVELVGRGSMVSEWAAAARAHAREAVRKGMGTGALSADAASLALEEAPPGTAPVAATDGDAAGPRVRGAIVTAVLVGDRAGIPAPTTDRLQRAGTFHVIAISGGNIAILTALVFAGLRLARVPPRVGALVTAAGIAGYGLVASGSASVTRATMVAVIYLTARALDLRAGGFAVLWSAMCALLVWSPLTLFDPGFLLTCGATIGILLSAVPPARTLEPGGATRGTAWGPLDWAWATVRATAAAEFVLLPVAATVFSRVTLAGLVLNLAAIPLMTIAQVSGLVMVGTSSAAPGLATLAGQVAHAAVQGLLSSSSIVDRWPWLSWRMPPPLWIAVFVYYASWATVAVSMSAGRWGRATATLLPAVGCTVWIAGAPAALPARGASPPPGPAARSPNESSARTPAARSTDTLQVVFFDVGQGDSALVRFPSGERWLIDTGGLPGSTSFDVGSRIVAPALWALGVRHLEVLALSHGHPDHAAGAASLIEDFSVREVWEGVPVTGDLVLARAVAVAVRHGARWRQQYRDTRVTIGRAILRVLHPPSPDWERRRVRNDDSLVLELAYGAFRVWFTGDVSRVVEEQLKADSTSAADPYSRLTVLKVPHHGSAGSSSEGWLRSLRPALAVVSAGAGNRFGHPAAATLSRFAALGIPVLRTDREGAVAVVTDGDRMTVSRWGRQGWVEVLLPVAGSPSGGT